MNDTMGQAFSCENLSRGKVLFDRGATNAVGSVEAVEAIIDTAQECFGLDPEVVTVDINERHEYK